MYIELESSFQIPTQKSLKYMQTIVLKEFGKLINFLPGTKFEFSQSQNSCCHLLMNLTIIKTYKALVFEYRWQQIDLLFILRKFEEIKMCVQRKY